MSPRELTALDPDPPLVHGARLPRVLVLLRGSGLQVRRYTHPAHPPVHTFHDSRSWESLHRLTQSPAQAFPPSPRTGRHKRYPGPPRSPSRDTPLASPVARSARCGAQQKTEWRRALQRTPQHTSARWAATRGHSSSELHRQMPSSLGHRAEQRIWGKSQSCSSRGLVCSGAPAAAPQLPRSRRAMSAVAALR